MKLIIEVPGKPVGKGRPRFARVGKFVKTYTPKETASAEQLIRLTFQQKYPNHVPIDRPIAVFINAYFPVPKSISKKLGERMAQENVPFGHRPDIDNVVKIIDSLIGVAFRDDALIYHIDAWKFYSRRPRTEIIIETRE